MTGKPETEVTGVTRRVIGEPTSPTNIGELTGDLPTSVGKQQNAKALGKGKDGQPGG